MQYRVTASSGLIRKATVLGLILVILVSAYYLFFYAPSKPKTGDGVECTSFSKDSIITFFYKPTSTPGELSSLITSVHGSIADHYTSLYGYGISVPTVTAANTQAKLKASPLVLSANVSATEGCLDPD